jgi:hypothetical protein
MLPSSVDLKLFRPTMAGEFQSGRPLRASVITMTLYDKCILDKVLVGRRPTRRPSKAKVENAEATWLRRR